MGGRFHGLPRMPRAEYLRVEAKVLAAFGGFATVPRYYANKPDFGDLDVIADSDCAPALPEIWGALGATSIGHNGHLHTAIVDGLQVDIFFTRSELIQARRAFMDFSDVGNIVGRMVRRMGMRFGEDGLFYVFRAERFGLDSQYRADLLLTRDFATVCDLLALDCDRWFHGFQEPRQMFDWVTASPWFGQELYLSNGESAPILKRAMLKHRTGILDFVEYVEAREWKPVEKVGVQESIDIADHHFGGVRDWVADRIADTEAKIAAAKRFNGRLVMSLRPDLTGKTLGEFMRAVRQREGFDDWIAVASDGDIESMIRSESLQSPNNPDALDGSGAV